LPDYSTLATRWPSVPSKSVIPFLSSLRHMELEKEANPFSLE
jgi:hypothetical protein